MLRRNLFLQVCVLFAALWLGAGELAAEQGRVYYKYTDDGGQLHIVQSLDRVPAQYRNQIGEIALDGDPLWTKSAAPKLAPQPPAKYDPVERRSSRRKSAVVFYYADWCGYCKKARRWLDERAVGYDLRDIENPRYGRELEEVSGKKSVPVLIIGGELIRGFDPAAYERALGG